MIANTEFGVMFGIIAGINSDKPITFQIYDLQMEMIIDDLIPGMSKIPFYDHGSRLYYYMFDISNLPSGCRYTVLVRQSFEGIGDLPIRSHNFCKDY
jgi:hypothetical protein